MDLPLLITVLTLLAALVLFVSERIRADLVALTVMVVLGATNVLTPQETFSGFSRSAVITLLAIFILAEGLKRTGVTDQVGNLLLRLAGPRERWLMIIVTLAAAFLSLFMNNIAAAAVLLPAVSGAAQRSGVSLSRLLMPLAFGTLLGGMATLLTTTNIVVSSLLRDQDLPGFGLLDFVPLGLPIVILGVLYLALVGRHLLPQQTTAELERRRRRSEADLLDVYRLGQRLFRARIPPNSSLIDKPLGQSTLREIYGISVVAIERGGQVSLSPPPDAVVQEGDIVLFEGDVEEFRRRDVEPYLEILPSRDWHAPDLESETVVVVESMLAPRSSLIGQTLRGSHFREKFGMTVLAIWREGDQISSGLADVPLRFGDALLLQGQRDRLAVLRDEPDLLVLTREEETALVPGRGPLALALMAATLLLAVLYPDALGEIMLGGALAMALTGVLTMDQAYQAVDWRVIFIVAGMLPMGIALTKTGAATLAAGGLIGTIGSAGPLALLAGLVLVGMLLTQAMNGAAVAILLAPIAIQAAQELGLDPRALAIGVALSTSMAFLTPLGHPVNLLVMGTGGYRFRDFVKVGAPLALLVYVLILLLLPLLWPLTPK
ncbi:MAG TPA: SLC13 family permease [Acidobacteriota bacterium]